MTQGPKHPNNESAAGDDARGVVWCVCVSVCLSSCLIGFVVVSSCYKRIAPTQAAFHVGWWRMEHEEEGYVSTDMPRSKRNVTEYQRPRKDLNKEVVEGW